MDIVGLDYNTTREKLVLSEYGREIQEMVHYAMQLPTKAERQHCAETIVQIMGRMTPDGTEPESKKQKLWDHLAIISNFELDIDYPVDLSNAHEIAVKPDAIEYPKNKIPVRHYGKMVFDLINKIKEMEPSEKRDELTRELALYMKNCISEFGHGSLSNERIADDIARFSNGVIQIDPILIKEKKVEKVVSNDKKRKRR